MCVLVLNNNEKEKGGEVNTSLQVLRANYLAWSVSLFCCTNKPPPNTQDVEPPGRTSFALQLHDVEKLFFSIAFTNIGKKRKVINQRR